MLPQSLHTKRSSGSPRLFAAAVWRQKSQTWSHSGISLSGLYNIYFIRKITFKIFLVNQVFIYILSRKPESKMEAYLLLTEGCNDSLMCRKTDLFLLMNWISILKQYIIILRSQDLTNKKSTLFECQCI